MTHFSTAIVSDTIWGALALSIFDFVACFFVLYFISFFIRGITYVDEKFLSKGDQDKIGEKNSSIKKIP